MSEEEKIQKIPEGLEDYDCLSEFDPGKFGEIEMKTYEVETIGDVELTDNEKKILQLHPKFSVLGKLEEDGLDFDQELANAKLRMTLWKEDEEKIEKQHDSSALTSELKAARRMFYLMIFRC